MKLQVNVNECVCDRIDRICEYTGLTRSSLCAAIISAHLPEWEKMFSVPSDSSDTSEDIEQITIDK